MRFMRALVIILCVSFVGCQANSDRAINDSALETEILKSSEFPIIRVSIKNLSNENVGVRAGALGLGGFVPNLFNVFELSSGEKKLFLGEQDKLVNHVKRIEDVTRVVLMKSGSLIVLYDLSSSYSIRKGECYSVTYELFAESLKSNVSYMTRSNDSKFCTRKELVGSDKKQIGQNK